SRGNTGGDLSRRVPPPHGRLLQGSGSPPGEAGAAPRFLARRVSEVSAPGDGAADPGAHGEVRGESDALDDRRDAVSAQLLRGDAGEKDPPLLDPEVED